MKAIYKILTACSFILIFLLVSGNSFSQDSQDNNTSVKQTKPDSLKLIEQYSLFSEYYKNKEFETALPYGWKVLEMNPQKFSKWIYYKMEDILWALHDSTATTPEMKKSIEDTILYVYKLALKYDSGDKTYFEPREAFVEETWLKMDPDKVIKAYEKAMADDPQMSTYYMNRLGQLYKNNQSDSNDYKTKAIDLYTKLSEMEPDNPAWPSQLESLVENIEELVKLDQKAWNLDKNNLEKAWKYGSTALKAGMYDDAITALEFLVEKSPKTINYWSQLASVYQKTEQLNKAEDAYKKLIQLEPEKKENYLNLGIIYKDKNQYSLARQYYQKASEVGNGWGMPIYYIGNLYEQAARNCKFDFETKLVYLLALQTYRRAKNIDPTLDQAAERIGALQSSIPTKEDYFFRGYKSGQTLPISGQCYGWIGRSVTIP
ncbi:MAG TPA: hypothetical protein VJ954_01185 [Ignavibacteriaceae bacterium]|nr:hypothetical protein [Ignavibacteriaceae bacterium]